MSDYFIYTPLTANSVARAADVNARFMQVSAGFDQLPPPDFISEDRVTFCVDIGVADSYVANPVIPIEAYTLGLHLTVQATNANTGVSTIDISGLGVKQIIRSDGTPLEQGDIVAGQMMELVYDGYAFQLAMAFAAISPSGIGDLIELAGDISMSGDLDVVGDITADSVAVTDDPYGGHWDANVSVPTKNAVYDKMETKLPGMQWPGYPTHYIVPGAEGLGLLESADPEGGYIELIAPTGTNAGGIDASNADGTAAFLIGGLASGMRLEGGPTLFYNDVPVAMGTDITVMVNKGGDTMTGPLVVPNDPYAAGWNGNLSVPTKDAVFDKIESITLGAGYLPMTGGTISGNLQVLGTTILNVATVAGSAVQTAAMRSTQTATYDKLAYVTAAGVMEIGPKIDLHSSDNDGFDYAARIEVGGATNKGINIVGVDGLLINGTPVTAGLANYVLKTGDTMTGNLNVNGASIGTTGSLFLNSSGTGIVFGAGPLGRMTFDGTGITIRHSNHYWARETDGVSLMSLGSTGNLTITGNFQANLIYGTAGGAFGGQTTFASAGTLLAPSNHSLMAYAPTGATNSAYMSFHRAGALAVYAGLDTDGAFAIGGWSWTGRALAVNMAQMILAGQSLWLDSDKMLFQHSGGHGYMRDQVGNLNIGAWGGTNTLALFQGSTHSNVSMDMPGLWIRNEGVAAGVQGEVNLQAGQATNSGYVAFYAPGGTRSGYIGFTTATELSIVPEGGRVLVCPTVIKSAGSLTFRHSDGAFPSANVTISTAAPSGGGDGDVWLKY